MCKGTELTFEERKNKIRQAAPLAGVNLANTLTATQYSVLRRNVCGYNALQVEEFKADYKDAFEALWKENQNQRKVLCGTELLKSTVGHAAVTPLVAVNIDEVRVIASKIPTVKMGDKGIDNLQMTFICDSWAEQFQQALGSRYAFVNLVIFLNCTGHELKMTYNEVQMGMENHFVTLVLNGADNEIYAFDNVSTAGVKLSEFYPMLSFFRGGQLASALAYYILQDISTIRQKGSFNLLTNLDSHSPRGLWTNFMVVKDKLVG